MRIAELREKRAKQVADAQEILKKADTMTAEDEQRFDALMAEADKLEVQIQREERAAKAAASLADTANPERRSGREDLERDLPDDADAKQAKLYEGAFRAWLKNGAADLPVEQRKILQEGQRALSKAEQAELRAQGTTSGAVGGYTIPEGFYAQIQEAMLAYGGMREVAFSFSTDSGNALPIPTDDDTSNEGEIIAENAQHNEQDITFGQAQLDAHLYSSKIIRVPWQLLQDSAFNMDAFIGKKFGDRLGRITNRHFTVGTGTSQPRGAVTASTAGKTAALSSAVTFDEIIDLKHSVDPAYRKSGRFMFNDSTLKALKKLKDAENRPLWMVGYREGEPDVVDGSPYTINQHMASIEAGAKSILYGDFSKYWIRDVRGMTMIRLVERYAEFGQVGFLAFLRTDGDLIDAGTHPLKHLVHPSP